MSNIEDNNDTPLITAPQTMTEERLNSRDPFRVMGLKKPQLEQELQRRNIEFTSNASHEDLARMLMQDNVQRYSETSASAISSGTLPVGTPLSTPQPDLSA